jgi:hypothetical protein
VDKWNNSASGRSRAQAPLEIPRAACATVETPDGKQIELKTGTGSINLRDVPHAGFKVVGNTALKLVTVYIVDKGSSTTRRRNKFEPHNPA